MTPFHAKYFAYDLTRTGGEGVDRLKQSLFNASVDLNPHQVEAALFAIRSPLSKGVLLADEVGLGKTIEAGLAMCQFWAEKRKLLVVCPASLRKQWQIELEDKFNLPAMAVDSRIYKKAEKEGRNPFDQSQVIIVSYHYAARMAEQLRTIQWDLVVIDEAHKLRNSHRASNKIGQSIRWALQDRRKLLLTATPLQNSLTELYGISTVIDEEMFGDLPTFRTLYANTDGDLEDLRTRINGYCRRTLRKDVQEFIRYTQRRLTTIRFRPTDDEHKLYESVSAFLQRKDSYAFPQQQRHLTIVVVRKVLASSPIALAYTLEVILARLNGLRDKAEDTTDITTRLLAQDEIGEDLLEELLEEIELEDDGEETPDHDQDEKIDLAKLESEIQEVEHYIRWARSIGIDTKTRHLLRALQIGYEKMAEIGAAGKALVFTESRRTQEHLKNFLEANGYAGKIVTFSGTNNSPEATTIYNDWIESNADTGKTSGSRQIDVRHALVDHFENDASIMIATEAAAEGINLQFCSLLINFDLPWNPQRIEQRIGRVHRYGQKHDVVVVNFLNERNAADQRVYELLRHKFCLFEGVFGASDEVLGQLDSSVGLERRILDLYQQCRTTEEIDAGFKELQAELDEQIESRMLETRQKLMEHFDEDVHSRIKVDYDDAIRALDSVGRRFWRLTKFILGERATFADDTLTFRLTDSPTPQARPGAYTLNRKHHYRNFDQESPTAEIDSHFLYRFSHPLGEYCIAQGQGLTPTVSTVRFDLSNYDAKLSAIDPYANKTGWLTLSRLVISSLDVEDYLLFSGFSDDGEQVDHDVIEQFFRLNGCDHGNIDVPDEVEQRLSNDSRQFASATTQRSLEENNHFFQERRTQLFRWADDVVAAAERNLAQVKAEVRAANRTAALATNVEEQSRVQETIRELEKKKRTARKKIFEIEDEIEVKRDALIAALQKKLVQDVNTQTLFTLRWEIV